MGGGGGVANCLARLIEAIFAGGNFFSNLIDMASQCNICISKYR